MLYSLSEIPIGTIVEKRIKYDNYPDFYAKFKKISKTEFLILDHSYTRHINKKYYVNINSSAYFTKTWNIVNTPKPSRPIKWI